MPFFEHNKVKLHYVDVDTRTDKSIGLPLLFIHGAGSSHITWALQLKEFSKTNRCIAIDLSGHGRSDDIADDVSIDPGFVLEVDSLVKYLDLENFILVGHSMGGGVAMSYILNDETVQPKALVLVDSSPNPDLTKLALGLVKDAVEEKLFLLRGQVFEDYTDTYKLKKYEDELRSMNLKGLQRDLLASHKFNITDKLVNIKVPTFALVGENDDIILPSVVKESVKLIPRADFAVVRGAHHVPMIEQPDEFNRLLRKFLTWLQDQT